ncbi:MAG: hypothetical protein SFY70_08340 [Bacteroidia bacterium]|nr:hypothetical protein [Bacteroidia bacterium]
MNIGQDGLYIEGDKKAGHVSSISHSEEHGWYINWAYNTGGSYEGGPYMDPGGFLVQQFGEIATRIMVGAKNPGAFDSYLSSHGLANVNLEYYDYNSESFDNFDMTGSAIRFYKRIFSESEFNTSQAVFRIENNYGVETGAIRTQYTTYRRWRFDRVNAFGAKSFWRFIGN